MDDHDHAARLEVFFASYARGLESFDADAVAAHYGFPCTMLTDEFAGSLPDADAMRAALSGGYEQYRRFGMAQVAHTLLDHAAITAKIVRARVRWHYRDAAGVTLTDSDYEYVLREDDGALKAYIAISINEQEKMQGLAQRRGGA